MILKHLQHVTGFVYTPQNMPALIGVLDSLQTVDSVDVFPQANGSVSSAAATRPGDGGEGGRIDRQQLSLGSGAWSPENNRNNQRKMGLADWLIL